MQKARQGMVDHRLFLRFEQDEQLRKCIFFHLMPQKFNISFLMFAVLIRGLANEWW